MAMAALGGKVAWQLAFADAGAVLVEGEVADVVAVRGVQGEGADVVLAAGLRTHYFR